MNQVQMDPATFKIDRSVRGQTLRVLGLISFCVFLSQMPSQTASAGQAKRANSWTRAGRRPASDFAATASSSEPSPTVKAAEEMLKHVKSALLRITVRLNGVPISSGLGFFTGADGSMLTSFEVVRSAVLNVAGTTIEFKTNDGSVIKTFTIANCGDQKNFDVCRLKLPVAAKNFLQIKSSNASAGEKVFVAKATPAEFYITPAVASSERMTSANVTSLVITDRVFAANIGAPVLSAAFEVTGMAARLNLSSFDDYGVIAANELDRYQNKYSSFMPLTQFVREFESENQRSANEQNKKITSLALKKVTSGHTLAGNPAFRESKLLFADENLSLYLPTQFGDCRFNGVQGVLYGTNGMSSVICPGKDGTSLFTLQRIRIARHGILQKMNNQRLVEAKAFTAIEDLDAELQWKSYEKKLTKAQRSQFFSQPSLTNCQRLSANPLPSSHFSSAFACRYTVKGDATPNGFTSSIWLESGNYIYGMNVWMVDSVYAPFLNNVASIAALSTQKLQMPKGSPAKNRKSAANVFPTAALSNAIIATTAKPTTPVRAVASLTAHTPGTYYKMSLPNGISFIASKKRADQTQYDTYGNENMVGEANANYALIVDRMNVIFRPSDYDRSVTELVSSVTRALGVKVNASNNRSEQTTLDGLAARLVSTTGLRDGKNVLILMIVGFGPNDTHLITQISDSTNPTKSFTDFRVMSSSFKRK